MRWVSGNAATGTVVLRGRLQLRRNWATSVTCDHDFQPAHAEGTFFHELGLPCGYFLSKRRSVRVAMERKVKVCEKLTLAGEDVGKFAVVGLVCCCWGQSAGRIGGWC